MMASTVARETMLVPPSNELDSECSSGGDDRVDTRKRARDDADTSSPKKRRKQTTPVRFPASLLSTDEHGETDDEADDEKADDDQHIEMRLDDNSVEKGKALLRNRAASNRDENLNSEFRCQFCGHLFTNKSTLLQHIDNDHSANNLPQSIIHSPITLQDQVRVKFEQPDEPESPVNLTGFSIKNFATSWLSSHAQAQLQIQDSEWSSQNSVTSSIPSHLPGLPFPGGLAPYLPLPTFALNDSGQLPRIGPAPIRIFNPDAYCDLCNKEFCNKYFLKTHKANKHGIYVDPPPNQSTSDSNNSMPFPSNNLTTERPPDQQMLKISVASIRIGTNLTCDWCRKQFANEESIRNHKQLMHPEIYELEYPSSPTTEIEEDDREVSRGSPGAMESLFKPEYGLEQEDSKYMPAPRHLSPQSSQQARDSGFNIDRLRRLGVMNPDAFCEICCKEYCNKYFLRTHKIKRHGIVIQESENSPTNPTIAASWHHIQTSPLNLIVTENPTNSESNDKFEESKCKICGLRFQTLGLYQAHKSKIHDNEEAKSPQPNNDDERTDSISEDLQKLQSMILQLNGIETSNTVTCGICGRECESKLALTTHMSVEHGTNVNEEPTSPLQQTENNSTTVVCTLCEKDYHHQDALREHIAEQHQQSTPNLCNQPTIPHVSPPAPVPPPIPPPPDKKLSSLTPTSSYCEICNKELCNKYFMKTHMQRMHGIEIENGSQIGGVICNICNKELCSKYFLRVHKHNTHGIVDEGTTTTSKPESFESTTTEDSVLKPENFGDLSHRYFTHFTEVCPICSRRFRSIKWLKAHLLGDHGKTGMDKWRELEQQYQNTTKSKSGSSSSRGSQQNTNLKIPKGMELTTQHLKTGDYQGLGNQVLSSLFGGAEEQQEKNYRCSYCNFSTTVLPFLFLHERSHTSNSENIAVESSLQCPICTQAFPQPELLHHHLLTRHQLSLPIIKPTLEGSRERIETIHQKEIEVEDPSRQENPQAQTGPDTNKVKRDEPAAVEVTPQGAYKCAQCGLCTANLHRIKKHIKKDHKTLCDPTDSVIDELSKTLRDVANKQKLPASYAMPQDINSYPDTTVMQPFIIEEQETGVNDDLGPERRFAPALVYLPVRARVSNVLTASFTLSPA